MASFNDFLDLYTGEFLPAYSDLVAYLADKPAGMLLDIEATFSHIMVYLTAARAAAAAQENRTDAVAQKNLDQAYNHMVRLILDCHKHLWVAVSEQIDQIYSDDLKRKFTVNMSEHEFVQKYHQFKKSAMEARRLEMQQVGKKPLEAIKKYRETTALGLEILDCFDPDKMRHYDSFSIRRYLKEHGAAILVGGVIGGILTTLVCYLFGILTTLISGALGI